MTSPDRQTKLRMRKRELDPRELCHDRLGESFHDSLSQYDTQRRVRTLVDEFLAPRQKHGARALDVGCGLGFFSQQLKRSGWDVTACDLGTSMLEQTRLRADCKCVPADAMHLTDYFSEPFDVVLSSECIEHTPDPMQALGEMAKLVAPGGYLALSTPNRLWKPVVAVASSLRLRPFDGYENFSSFRKIRRSLENSGLQILEERGLHLFPFQFRMHAISQWCDRNLQLLRWAMINLCVLAQRPINSSLASDRVAA